MFLYRLPMTFAYRFTMRISRTRGALYHIIRDNREMQGWTRVGVIDCAERVQDDNPLGGLDEKTFS